MQSERQVLEHHLKLSESSNELSPEINETQVKAKHRAQRRTFSLAYKLKILEEYESCADHLARGALLRKEGLYYSRISTWRKQRDEGTLSSKTKGKSKKAVLVNQQLSRENAQLKKKLAQAEAVIELQKKVSELLGTHILPPENNELL